MVTKASLHWGVLLLCLSPLSAADSPKDPRGWQEAKWGMTESQIIKVLNGSATLFTDNPIDRSMSFGVSRFGIENFQINRTSFRVLFFMDPGSKGGLMAVMLQPLATTREPPPVIFSDLRALLVSKYGTPTCEEEPPGIVSAKSCVWEFPSTVVTLSLISSKYEQYMPKLTYRRISGADKL